MRGESVESHTRARSLAGAGAGAGGARHAREWSAEIRPLALRGRGYLLPFILTDRYKISTDCEIFVGG
jgi:hypothetical protein